MALMILMKVGLLVGGLVGGVWFCVVNISGVVVLEVPLLNSGSFFLKVGGGWGQKFFFLVFFVISLAAVLYSFYYMKFSGLVVRFILVKFFFVASMVILIFSKSLLSVFVGWDGLGVTSFFLVVFYLNMKSAMGGVVTLMMNRVGDGLMLILFLMVLFSKCGMKSSVLPLVLVLVCLLIFFTKSAQFPFSTWLPLAMAAPTPVSALVHSSTLVAAGIYLMLDNFLFLSAGGLMGFVFTLVFFTFFISGGASLFEMDMKKIIALSTLNQLSLMFIALSFGLITFSYLHLLAHAVFKSLLFFNGGVFLHFFYSLQDYRGFQFFSSFGASSVIFSLLVSLFNLMGLSFLSGFYSKDFIVGGVGVKVQSVFFFIYLFSLAFTFFYCGRLVFMGLGGSSVAVKSFYSGGDGVLLLVVIPLSFGAMLVGKLFSVFMGCLIFPGGGLSVFIISLLLVLFWLGVGVVKAGRLFQGFSSSGGGVNLGVFSLSRLMGGVSQLKYAWEGGVFLKWGGYLFALLKTYQISYWGLGVGGGVFMGWFCFVFFLL